LKRLDASGAGGMDPEEQVADPCKSIANDWERDVVKSENVLQRTHTNFDIAPIVIWDDNCNDQVEVAQGIKLSNDGRLNLPKSGCGVAVLKT
jgi:hypothetical protein